MRSVDIRITPLKKGVFIDFSSLETNPLFKIFREDIKRELENRFKAYPIVVVSDDGVLIASPIRKLIDDAVGVIISHIFGREVAELGTLHSELFGKKVDVVVVDADDDAKATAYAILESGEVFKLSKPEDLGRLLFVSEDGEEFFERVLERAEQSPFAKSLVGLYGDLVMQLSGAKPITHYDLLITKEV